MSKKISILWQTDLPTWVKLPVALRGGEIIARVGKEIRAFDAQTGADRWSVSIDPAGGAGHILHVHDDLVLTDRRPDPAMLTEIVAVRDGRIAFTADLGSIVARDATVVAGGALYAIGMDPERGPVLRAVNLERGTRTVDVALPSGADMLFLVGDRLLVVNRVGSPGLYWLALDGTGETPLEETPVQEARLAGGRALSALRNAEFPRRTAQVRDLETGAVLWTAPAHGPVIGLDETTAIHFEGAGDAAVPVARDAKSGALRWRGSTAVEEPSALWFAGSSVFLRQPSGFSVHRLSDGEVIDEVELGNTAQLLGERLYLGGYRFLVCAEPDMR